MLPCSVPPATFLDLMDYDRYTLFPFSLVERLVAALRVQGARFECFADRPIAGESCGSVVNYAREYSRYKTGSALLPVAAVATVFNRVARRAPRFAAVSRLMGWRRPRVPAVVLHHDADRQPHKTVDMMRLEQRLGVVSSSYFFVRRCARWPGDIEPYEVDFEALRSLEEAGFEVGYHLNAAEQVGYDWSRAAEVAEADLELFRREVNLRSYVPHGGVPGPGGVNNEHTPRTGSLSSLVWAYNGRGFINDVAWSDGYAEGAPALKLADPIEVARRLNGRMRGHFLLHPQYYGHKLRPDWADFPISRVPWWRALWGL
jgi:hypothetical protein